MQTAILATALENNPGLAPFDISDYQGLKGKNYYEEDAVLQRIVRKYSAEYSADHKKAMEEHLHGYGELVGGVLNDLTMAAHQEGKYGEIVQYDRTGNRIDEVRYCPEQLKSRRISYEYGIVNLDFHPDWQFPFTMLHRMALAYLCNMNGEGGIGCPLAMTDGLIRALNAVGSREQREKYLPLIAGPESGSHFMVGQYVTERVGGSNVAANRTVARQKNGKWILDGEKWFCSNPGDVWVTTARIEDTSVIGLFLVSRFRENGDLNGSFLVRKKDIIGTRGKVTAECVYCGLEAEPLGRGAHGLANLMRHIIQISRIHVAAGALAGAQRAFMEARAYARRREAYGRKIGKFPSVLRTLAEMRTLHTAALLSVFKDFMLLDAKHPAESLLTPLLKYSIAVHATWAAHEAIMIHGGNGILNDFSCLPRLLNDALINETWEGTHQIITEHAVKAYAKPKVRAAFREEVVNNLAAAEGIEGLERAIAVATGLQEELREMGARSETWLETNRLIFCDVLYNLFALSEIAAEAALVHRSRGKDARVLTAQGAAFAEIIERGRMGPTIPGGVFDDIALMQAIADY